VGRFHEKRRDISKDAEGRSADEKAHRHRQQDLRTPQRDDFLLEARTLAGKRRGHPELKGRPRNDANDRERPERGAPSKRMPDRCRAGTPTRLAAEKPSHTRDTARALRSGGTLAGATIAAMPRKAACEIAASARAPMRNP
jgi:hypothetical protein